MHAQNDPLVALMPKNIEGWEIDGPDTTYNSDNLYDYIDGGAELYLSYGMNQVISRRYINARANTIRVEIFDMVYAENAFGVFSQTRTLNENMYGQGSQYFPGTQIFWKDKYFISVTADDVSDEIKKCIFELSMEIDHNIQTMGSLPELLELLPYKSELKENFIFFHHYIWQNAYEFISNENIFNINHNTQAVIAKYGEKNDRSFLLLIDYHNQDEAEKAEKKFFDIYLSNKENNEPVGLKNERYWGCTQKNGILVCILNAKDQKLAHSLLDESLKLITDRTKKQL